MYIVLDYDETYTERPLFWDAFIDLAKTSGVEIVCCTMRFQEPSICNKDVIEDMGRHNIEIVYAAPYKDKWEAMENAGYIPENAIWIDDRPMFIFMDRVDDEYKEL